ncbi:uncharacterized protein L201_001551 [Kwoniella dendrophila CBS 6074]|uniref:WSC domain-containing protein n=1 Tax=Kwoniella dendrophila CBS 6074 TaxID=1295534 RepID=A0AAX4JP45_9TREE
MRVEALIPVVTFMAAQGATAAPVAQNQENLDKRWCLFGVIGTSCGGTASKAATSSAVTSSAVKTSSSVVASSSAKAAVVTSASAVASSKAAATVVTTAAATSTASWSSCKDFNWNAWGSNWSWGGYNIEYVKAWYIDTYGLKPPPNMSWKQVSSLVNKFGHSTAPAAGPKATSVYKHGCNNPWTSAVVPTSTAKAVTTTAAAAVSTSKAVSSAAASSAVASVSASKSAASSAVASASASASKVAASSAVPVASSAAVSAAPAKSSASASAVSSATAAASSAAAPVASSAAAASSSAAGPVVSSVAAAASSAAAPAVSSAPAAVSSAAASAVDPAASAVSSAADAAATGVSGTGSGSNSGTGVPGTGAGSNSATGTATSAAAPAATSAAVTINGFTSGGCVQEVSGRLLSLVQTSSSTMTIEQCTTLCGNYGYGVAGLEYGNECYCGVPDDVDDALVSGQCYMPCAGDSTEICGGPNALNIFINPDLTPATINLPSGWSTYGVVAEGTSGRALTTTLWSSPTNTIESCANGCAAAGFTIAGTEYSSECYCGNSFSNGGGAIVDSSSAFMACSGDLAQMCGGPSILSVVSSITGTIPSQ